MNVTALVAGLGIGGIAIGLAAQGIFSDLFAALAILFDRPFRRGDTIRFDQTIGTVEKIGLKTTRLRSLTGEQLAKDRGLDASPLVRAHEQWGDRLMWVMWAFAALVAVAFWVLPHVTRLVGAQDRPGRWAVAEKPVMVLVPATAVAAVVLVVLTGDAGARAVWQQ